MPTNLRKRKAILFIASFGESIYAITERTEMLKLAYLTNLNRAGKERFTEKMKRKIGKTIGLDLYGMRLAICTYLFAHIRSAMSPNRFSLRGKKNVNSQWNLFCMVHNLKKVHAFGTIGV